MIPCSRKWIDADDIAAVAEASRTLGDADTDRRASERREAFERDFAQAVGSRYAVAVTTGIGAMHVACLAAGLRSGAEVILSPIAPAKTANAALLCGATPIFADVTEDTVNLNPDDVAARLTNRTAAVIAHDFAGHPADLPALRPVALRAHAVLIEDGSQALGSQSPHGQVGNCRFSDLTVFTALPGDALSFGGGGFVTTNRRDLYDRLRNFSLPSENSRCLMDEEWRDQLRSIGVDLQPGDLQCALGQSQLKKLDRVTQRNRAIAARYDQALAGIARVARPAARSGYEPARSRYAVRLRGASYSERRRIFDRLQEEGVGVDVHHVPVYWQSYYCERYGHGPGLCPVAERHYRETISLPLYPTMTEDQVAHVIDSLTSATSDLFGARTAWV
jgi:dTDP-4-amino-4,6-dideoxygalactose transaminase